MQSFHQPSPHTASLINLFITTTPFKVSRIKWSLSTHGCFSLQKLAVQLLGLEYMYYLSAYNQIG